MQIDIKRETPDDLEAWGTVPITFTVNSRFRIEWIDNGLGGIKLIEEPVDPPIHKDFDGERGKGPERWRDMFGDISHWGIFAAFVEGQRAGGAVVAYDTPGYGLLEGRKDLANLTNIRVASQYRRKGIGAKLFQHAVLWSKENTDCKRFKIETQNTNINACRFYASQGAKLGGIQYLPESPDGFEMDLFWYIQLK